MQLTCSIGIRVALAAVVLAGAVRAEDSYFVTYSHHMEEPGSLELAVSSTFGEPNGGNRFSGSLMELEYGVTAWWTSEFYLAGQSTAKESTLFTGYRIENRVRPLRRQHWINPVLYFEFEDINGADKSLKEVVGHDGIEDQLEMNAEARLERKRELEMKLILSSDFRGWNISENLIAEKNLANEPWEFGYAIGINRPFALAASPNNCSFCRENFRAGVEFYGGLGDRHSFGLQNTSHYVAPLLAWSMPNGLTLSVSPGFGLTDTSHGLLMRVGLSYEVQQFGRQVKSMFR